MNSDLLRSIVPPPIISQLVLFLRQTVEIDPLGHLRVVEALQNFVQKCDPVTLSGIEPPYECVNLFPPVNSVS